MSQKGVPKLTEKQKRFCLEFMIDGNGAQAAIRAGYSKRTSQMIASENLTKPIVSDYLNKLRNELAERNKLKADDVIQELKALGFWNMQDFIDEGNVIKDITKLPRELTKSVVGIKVKQTFLPNPNGEGEPIEEITTELKMVDKRGALVDIGKHLGVFEKDNRQKAPVKIRVKSNNTQNNFGENK